MSGGDEECGDGEHRDERGDEECGDERGDEQCGMNAGMSGAAGAGRGGSAGADWPLRGRRGRGMLRAAAGAAVPHRAGPGRAGLSRAGLSRPMPGSRSELLPRAPRRERPRD